ncbi:MAG: FtsX-like permease family protein [Ruminococcus sp.]|nr:FtsX-like permease family protein [Ruminococcus sp.]
MTKLFTIVIRWMKKDRKRTLLSFLSIVMAMYLLTFLGIYFSSAVSMMRSLTGFEDGTYHAEFICRSADQAKLVTKNASVSEGALYVESPDGSVSLLDSCFYDKYCDKNKGGDNDFVPLIKLNGTSYDTLDLKYVSSRMDMCLAAGNLSELSEDGIKEINGRFPENSNEILLGWFAASELGLKIGDTLEIEVGARKARAEYATLEMPLEDPDEMITKEETDEYGYSSETDTALGFAGRELGEKLEKVPDTEYKPDETGEAMNAFYNSFRDNRNDLSRKLYNAANGKLSYTCCYDEENKKAVCTAIRLTPLDETVDVQKLSYTVVGIDRNGICPPLCFYVDDPFAKPFFEFDDHGQPYMESPYRYTAWVRIKDGLDIDTEVAQIRNSADIPKDDLKRSYVIMNNDLIFYEGRGFEYATGGSSGVVIMFLVMVLVAAVFVFFARLIINNAFELSSAYRAEQYGALKTIGASNRQIFAMVLTECIFYLIAALPISVGLAVLTGKAVISGIRDIRIFDLQYGAGISDRFFTLEIIPAILIASVIVAAFSVLFSGYACAIRIRKLSPIDASKAQNSKKVKAKKRKPLQVGKLGFPFIYAIRSARKSFMHVSITILAAIISGTIVITIFSLLKGIESGALIEEKYMEDFWVGIENTNAGKPFDIYKEYKRLENSGLFENIRFSSSGITVTDSEHTDLTDEQLSFLNDEYIGMFKKYRYDDTEGLKINIFPITRESFKDIGADLSYDEFLAADGVLVSNSAYAYNDEGSATAAVIKEGATELALPPSPESESGSWSKVKIAGLFVPESGSSYVCYPQSIYAYVPFERFYDLAKGLVDDGANVDLSNMYTDFQLNAVSGKEEEAKAFLESFVQDPELYANIQDNVTHNLTLDRIGEALRLAGVWLSIIIFAVAMINIISTSSANIVNRRRELSMLRSCGMPMRDIFKSLTFEALLCTLIASIISGVAAYFATKLIGTEFMGLPETKMSFWSFGGTFLLMLAVMLLPYLLPLRSMAASPIASEIRSKE